MSHIIFKYFSAFDDRQTQQIEAMAGLYKEWNEKINVISRKDIDHFYMHHVLHSLAIATQFEFKSQSLILDLGCGGGFPGIPLAIMFPEVKFLLADSINKKLTVVKGVANSLALNNVETRHTRAEEIKDLKFDVVVSRAVAPLKDLIKMSKPLLKKKADPGGLVCLKGGDLSQEIHESGSRPRIWEIEKMFEEPWFKGKYLLHVPL